MASDMMVVLKMIEGMVKASLSGRTEEFMMVAGKQANSMVKEHLLAKTAKLRKATGRMERESNGLLVKEFS
jgi:hypothetical protein